MIFPTLSDESILTKESFDRVVNLCNSLYQKKPNTKNEKFEGHLHQLDPIDGLKLSTAQMMIRGGGVILMPGGDLLRMSNNIIKLRQLEEYLATNSTSPRSLSVAALSMDDFITDPTKFTLSYLNILTGNTQLFRDQQRKGKAVVEYIANQFGQNYNKMKSKEKHEHVTTGKHDDRPELIESLKNDEILGPILDAIERLVNDALH